MYVLKSQTSKVMPDYIYIHNELKRKKQTKVTLVFTCMKNIKKLIPITVMVQHNLEIIIQSF
jgi:hypothetical protein